MCLQLVSAGSPAIEQALTYLRTSQLLVCRHYVCKQLLDMTASSTDAATSPGNLMAAIVGYALAISCHCDQANHDAFQSTSGLQP